MDLSKKDFSKCFLFINDKSQAKSSLNFLPVQKNFYKVFFQYTKPDYLKYF